MLKQKSHEDETKEGVNRTVDRSDRLFGDFGERLPLLRIRGRIGTGAGFYGDERDHAAVVVPLVCIGAQIIGNELSALLKTLRPH